MWPDNPSTAYLVLCLGSFGGGVTKGVTGFGSAILNLCCWIIFICLGVQSGTLTQAVVCEALSSTVIAPGLLYVTRAHQTADFKMVTAIGLFVTLSSPVGAAILAHLDAQHVELVMAATLLAIMVAEHTVKLLRHFRSKRKVSQPQQQQQQQQQHSSEDTDLCEPLIPSKQSLPAAATAAIGIGSSNAASLDGSSQPASSAEWVPQRGPCTTGSSIDAIASCDLDGTQRSGCAAAAALKHGTYAVSSLPGEVQEGFVTAGSSKPAGGGYNPVPPGDCTVLVRDGDDISRSAEYSPPGMAWLAAADTTTGSGANKRRAAAAGTFPGPAQHSNGDVEVDIRAAGDVAFQKQPLLGTLDCLTDEEALFADQSSSTAVCYPGGRSSWCSSSSTGCSIDAGDGEARVSSRQHPSGPDTNSGGSSSSSSRGCIVWLKVLGMGSIAGTLSGIMEGLTGMNGPPIMFMYRKLNTPKAVVRGNNAWLNLLQFRLVPYWYMGLITRRDLQLYGVTCAAGVVGALVGDALSWKVNQAGFQRVLGFLMVLCCGLMFVSGLGYVK